MIWKDIIDMGIIPPIDISSIPPIDVPEPPSMPAPPSLPEPPSLPAPPSLPETPSLPDVSALPSMNLPSAPKISLPGGLPGQIAGAILGEKKLAEQISAERAATPDGTSYTENLVISLVSNIVAPILKLIP